jgi:hypothetical protein
MLVEQHRALWLHCEKCHHAAKMAINDLMSRHGNLELQVVLERAVCTRCGGRWPDVTLQVPPVNAPKVKQ